MKKLNLTLHAFLFLIMGSLAHAGALPDASKTPGAIRAVDVQTLCTTKTSAVRNVTKSTKQDVLNAYGNPPCDNGQCEIDHLISLELGGSNDISNLWPQSYIGACNAHQKDRLENRLHALVCRYEIGLEAAQHEIATDWIDAYRKYLDPIGCEN